jgi:hypothetical protein
MNKGGVIRGSFDKSYRKEKAVHPYCAGNHDSSEPEKSLDAYDYQKQPVDSARADTNGPRSLNDDSNAKEKYSG